MHARWIAALGAATALGVSSAAVASHVTQVDPGTVPAGFLVAHNAIDEVPLSALARAVKPDGTDLLIQHVRLGANAATGWHTHPGPALVAVAKGSLAYQEAKANVCRSVPYGAGEGFLDRGFGHVHRAVAGADGVDFYVVYLLPPGTETHVVPATAPAQCNS